MAASFMASGYQAEFRFAIEQTTLFAGSAGSLLAKNQVRSGNEEEGIGRVDFIILPSSFARRRSLWCRWIWCGPWRLRSKIGGGLGQLKVESGREHISWNRRAPHPPYRTLSYPMGEGNPMRRRHAVRAPIPPSRVSAGPSHLHH